ncbi:MAG: ATP-binding protein, partial [Deltaproteobacteria bacterium]|nr:ATP-binding protein [Deltaproteobacteria bacterium]
LSLVSLFSFLLAEKFPFKYIFSETSTHIWLRLCIGLLIPLPIVVIFLISTFLKDENNLSVELYTIQYIFAPILIVGLSTPIFNNREFIWFSISYVFGMLLFAFTNLLYIGFKEENFLHKKRVILLSLLGMLTILFLILSLKIKNTILLSGIDALFIILFLYYVSESVLNGKLLDFQEFVSRILILIVISVIISVIYWIFVILISYKPSDMLLNSLAVSISITLIFDRLRQYVAGFVSSYVTASKRDFTARIKKLRKEISSIIDADKLLKRVADEIFASQKVSSCTFLILSEERTYYKSHYALGQQTPERIDNILDHSLIEMLNEQRQIVVKEIIEKRYSQESALSEESGQQLKTRDVLNSLNRLNISLLFPVFIENEMYYLLAINDTGVIEPLNAEELGELIELMEQVSISLQNLKIFEGIKEKDRLAALGEMAAGLAHEIRNPLGAIKGAAQYLNPSNLPQEEADFLKIIIEETDRLNRVLTQFLDYSRPYQGEFTVVSLDGLLRQIIRLFSSDKEQKYNIVYSNSSEDSVVRIDTEQFRQVMINILKNAQEAMPEGGKIEIKVFKDNQIGRKILSTVLMRERERSEKIFIDITDHGVGIDEKDIHKVFIPFFTTKKSGTGLGLAISRKIIESQNGRLEIFSKKGEGTTVRITLPSVQPESSK